MKSRNDRKPTLTRPITPRMRATMSSGRLALKSETASIQVESIVTQSSSEPSWLPQVAATR